MKTNTEIWNEVYDDTLYGEFDEIRAVKAADQAVCQHKLHREFSSDFWDDPVGIPYRHWSWQQCSKCGIIIFDKERYE